MAEREGFEPPEQLPVHRISSAARSTTPASFLKTWCKGITFFLFDAFLFDLFWLVYKNLLWNGNRESFFVLKKLNVRHFFTMIFLFYIPIRFIEKTKQHERQRKKRKQKVYL